MNTKPPKRIGNASTRYNTPLSATEEAQYQKWVKTLPVNLRNDYDYDLRGAWLAKVKPDQYGHMPDLYKKPWHPTFSMESYYSMPPNEGGDWKEDMFIPSNTNKVMDAIRQSPFYQYGDYPYASYTSGGKIHIKKENRGKFTEAANRAGKSIQAYASQILANKEHYSPTLVKRANFARNASKWHAEGGPMDSLDDPPFGYNPQNMNSISTLYSQYNKPSVTRPVSTVPVTWQPRDYAAEIEVETNNRSNSVLDGTKTVQTNTPSAEQVEEERRLKLAYDAWAQSRGYANAEEERRVIQSRNDAIARQGEIKPDTKDIDREAANWGYAIGAGHPMNVEEVNNWNLKNAELAGWIAAPNVMSAITAPYYTVTGRPGMAALTALPMVGAVKSNIVAVKDALRFNIANRGTGVRMLYPWQELPTTSYNATSSINKNIPTLGSAIDKSIFTLQRSANIATLNPSKQILSLPQSTEIYPQIKPLIRGAEIEKQLSKTRTINRKQLQNYITKQGKYYQKVMDDVLNSEFANVEKIDYDAYRDAVQKKLPKYQRVAQSEYQSYGMDRLGFENKKISDDTGGILEYTPGVKTNTFTFESSGIAGNNTHYSGQPIGHSRTYTTKEEPNVLHVMESQSDWAQNTHKLTEKQRFSIQRKIEKYEQALHEWERALRIGINPDGSKMEPSHRYQIEHDFIPHLQETLLYTQANLFKDQLMGRHMIDSYLERQIQENLKYAAEQEQTKMRYPTRETAAKIEGYPKVATPTEEAIELMRQSRMFPGDFNNNSLSQFIQNAKEAINRKDRDERFRLSMSEHLERLYRLKEILENSKVQYKPEHESILKKYDSFPKQYQKLFGKKAEVRTVTDNKGNSWYEVDIPENYKNKTAEIQFDIEWNGLKHSDVTRYMKLSLDDLQRLKNLDVTKQTDLELLAKLSSNPNESVNSLIQKNLKRDESGKWYVDFDQLSKLAKKEYQLASGLQKNLLDKSNVRVEDQPDMYRKNGKLIFGDQAKEIVTDFINSDTWRKHFIDNRVKYAKLNEKEALLQYNEYLKEQNNALKTVRRYTPVRDFISYDDTRKLYKSSLAKGHYIPPYNRFERANGFIERGHTITTREDANLGTKVHEYVHASDYATGDPGAYGVNLFISKLNIKNNISPEISKEWIKYVTDPIEVRARAITTLIQLERMGIDPNDVYAINKFVEQNYNKNLSSRWKNFNDLTKVYSKTNVKKILNKILAGGFLLDVANSKDE